MHRLGDKACLYGVSRLFKVVEKDGSSPDDGGGAVGCGESVSLHSGSSFLILMREVIGRIMDGGIDSGKMAIRCD